MRVEQTRPNVFRLTGTSLEISTLVAAARLALDAMREGPAAPREGVDSLERVLADYDAALARLGPPAG